MNKCFIGDCRETMTRLISEGVKVQTCITSPPYWGLRDYGHEGQLGLEGTPEEYVSNMVEVFRLVRELLAEDGTLWLNLGDSYAGSSGPGSRPDNKTASKYKDEFNKYDNPNRKVRKVSGLKLKDLVGIPWLVAFALRADGWYLRSDIIWHKPNPMPESVTDRPTKAHEYIFLMSKSQKYYYINDAIAKQHAEPERGKGEPEKNNWSVVCKRGSHETVRLYNPAGRNNRTVWTVATQPFKDAH